MERVEGNRKARVRISGNDARAIQDAARKIRRPYSDMSDKRAGEVADTLLEIVERYTVMDQANQMAKAAGINRGEAA